jgi:hypothetical protein
MNWNHARERRTTGRIWIAIAVASAFAVSMPGVAQAGQSPIVPPPMPGNIVVDDGSVPYLVGHAFGTQNYVCLPTSTGVAFSLFTPEATLVDDSGDQVITHFFGPNPEEPNTNPALFATGVIRAAWQDSHDGSTIWGKVNPGDASTDPRFVEKDAIAWLKVTKAGVDTGLNGGDKLTKTTFVQRLSTHGGVAPKTGCLTADDIGHLAFVPYTADYFFYKAK